MGPVVGIAAQLAIGAIVSTVAGGIVQTLGKLTSGQRKVSQPKISSATPEATVAAESPLANSSEPGGPQIGVMGRGRVGGRILASAKNGNASYTVLNIAGSPLTVNAIYVNNGLVARSGTDVTTAPWKTTGQTTSMNIALYDGSQTTVDSVMAAAFAGWTAQFIGYKQSYARIKIDPSVHTSYATVYSGGVPDFTFDVSGFPCYDPRDSAQDVNNRATWTTTKNSALICAGYLVHELGRDLPVTSVDWNSVATAADVCDQQVLLASGLSENRYECFLVWRTDERHEDVIAKITNSMAGYCYRVGGKYVVEAGTRDVSAAVDVTPDDYAGDGLSFSDTNAIDTICNGVRGQFASPTNNYELRDYPAYQDAAALAEDGGLDYWLEVDFPAVSSASQAQRLARIAYRRARYGSPASIDTKFSKFDTVRGDWIRVNDDLAGFVNAYFRVEKDALSGDDLVLTFDLSAEAANTYDWSVTDEQAMPPPVSLTSAGGAGVNPDDAGALQPPGGTLHVVPGSSKGSYNIQANFFNSPQSRVTHVRYSLQLFNSAGGSVTQPLNEVTVGNNAFNTLNFNAGVLAASNYWTSTRSPGCLIFGVSARCATTGEVSPTTYYTLPQPDNPSSIMNVAPFNAQSTTTIYILPPPPAPQIASQGAGTAVVNFYQGGGGSRATNIELWENTTNNFNTATKINDVANANGTKNVTGTPGSTKYYWTRSRNAGDGKISPISNPLLIGF